MEDITLRRVDARIKLIPLLHRDLLDMTVHSGSSPKHLKARHLMSQAAEKQLQELNASMKQSQKAEAQVAALRKELDEAQAAVQASQEAIKASDSEKVYCVSHQLIFAGTVPD